MGDFPTHNCTVTHDGDQLPVVMPISISTARSELANGSPTSPDTAQR
jgi:hypothetical protein